MAECTMEVGRTLEAPARRRFRGTATAVRQAVPELIQRAGENNLLTHASAVSFQVLTAIVPFLLFVLALLGLLDLSSVWRDNLAPDVKPELSPALFTVVNDTVQRVLSSKHVFWVTFGLALAVWQISGAVRVVTGALNRIYGAGHERPLRRRYVISLLLALALGACSLAALAVVRFTPLLYADQGPLGVVALVLRWAVAASLMLLAVGLLVRYAPNTPQPLGWVGFGSLVVVGAWVIASLLFGLYLSEIADYGSVFGALAAVIVLMAYVYLSAMVFLLGLQLDAIVRERVEGSPSGEGR